MLVLMTRSLALGVAASFGGIHIANSEGCQGKEFLSLRDGSIGVTPKSLLDDIVHVPSTSSSASAVTRTSM